MYPPPPDQIAGYVKSVDGIFTKYSAKIAAKDVDIAVEQVAPSGLPRSIYMGKRRKPEPPTDADFNAAATWQITIPPHALDNVQNVILKINYVGDVARAYIGERLIDDDFYYGHPWEIGLKRFAPEVLEKGITIKILPMPTKATIYMQEDLRPRLTANGETTKFRGVDLIGVTPEMIYEATMQ
jgi:hypothetical protein